MLKELLANARRDLLASIKRDLKRAGEFIGIMIHNEDTLYETAFASIGQDASPHNLAPQELACAESVSTIVRRAFPELRFPLLLSTRELFAHLAQSPSFAEIGVPEYGCIIVSVTGAGNGNLSNGHTGIIGKHLAPDGSLWIMSNDSRTGTWEVNFSIASWMRYYFTRGGMPTHFFRYIA